jgi:hypothetical protein
MHAYRAAVIFNAGILNCILKYPRSHIDVSTTLDAGIAGSRFLRLLLKQDEVKVNDPLSRIYQLLAELGYFVKRGDRYRRTNKIPPSIPSRLLGAVFDEIIIPHLLGDSVKLKYEALFAATALFQGLRIKAASRFEKGTLALVAGWLPCGFSTEIWEVLSLEEERVSLLPLELDRIGESMAPSLYVSFEVGRLEDLPLDKYGRFSFAVICHRDVDLRKMREAAEKIYRVNFAGALGIFADLLADALNLGQGGGCGQGGRVVYRDSEVCITDVSSEKRG